MQEEHARSLLVPRGPIRSLNSQAFVSVGVLHLTFTSLSPELISLLFHSLSLSLVLRLSVVIHLHFANDTLSYFKIPLRRSLHPFTNNPPDSQFTTLTTLLPPSPFNSPRSSTLCFQASEPSHNTEEPPPPRKRPLQPPSALSNPQAPSPPQSHTPTNLIQPNQQCVHQPSPSSP